jgi:hypothetical protein
LQGGDVFASSRGREVFQDGLADVVQADGGDMNSDSVWVSAVAMENTLVQMISTDRTDAVWPAIMEARMPSASDPPMMA